MGKSYSTKGMVSLFTIDNFINKVYISDYMNEYVSLWLSILAHIGSTMKILIKFGLISCDVNNFEKQELYIKPKMNKKPFHIVERNTNLLDLVYSNLSEFNGMLIHGEISISL